MPLTPFHYPVANLIHRLDERLSLPGLLVGSMLPDIEVPIIFLFSGSSVPYNRLVLHSLLGAVTLGAFLSLILTIVLYPAACSVFSIDKLRVKEKCALSVGLVLSCSLGGLSHVLLDITNHDLNPILWPFLTPTMQSPISLALGGTENASLIIHVTLTILFLGLFYNRREHFWEQVLIGKWD